MTYEQLWMFLGLAIVIGVIIRIRELSIKRKKNAIIKAEYKKLKAEKKNQHNEIELSNDDIQYF